MSIKFQKHENQLRWNNGSYNTYYFDNQEEFKENKKALESINQNYSAWSDMFGRFCLQILQ